MADSTMVSIPADLAADLLYTLNTVAQSSHGAPVRHAALALAHALARHNPPQDSAFGPMGDQLFSANDPTAWQTDALENLKDG